LRRCFGGQAMTNDQIPNSEHVGDLLLVIWNFYLVGHGSTMSNPFVSFRAGATRIVCIFPQSSSVMNGMKGGGSLRGGAWVSTRSDCAAARSRASCVGSSRGFTDSMISSANVCHT